MQCKGKTDIGLWRKENQDVFLIREINGNTLGIVCDGMGGMQDGGIASKLASEEFADYIVKTLSDAASEDAIKALLVKAASEANSTVFDYSVAHRLYYGTGTTLVSFLKTPDTLYVLNIGDSRCYKLYNGTLTRVTKDHSYVQQLIDIGSITEEEAKDHPDGNVITRSVGTESSVKADLFTETEYDAVLLCSDGLTKCVDEEKIKDIMCTANDDAASVCDLLVEAAKEAGGIDNITVVVLC